ncbi:MAG: PLP-dependent aminotransferase family protein [Microcella sp.]|uniref:MocR-like transcription factor YczR n=1 Tax=Microcella sp. TaxID=1913979 RepID=UPI0024CDF0C0|nr:PLP-dependent aminotransferase family protein [Microcella sp.]UYN82886.1 MAG: PLP-dependent aminotransferase family protein [Microcella sp.]
MPSLSARALASQLGEWRPHGTTPLYEALADRVRLLILDGRISLGTRLPAERLLAEHEDLSRTTVAAAYARLRELGFAESLRGSGTVARLPRSFDDGAPALGESAGPGIIDLSKATLTAIPLVAEAAREAADLLPAHLHESGFDPVGLRVLRQAIADRYTARGLPTTADEILITLGAQHAIALITRTLLSRGDRALIEAPSYPHAVEALQHAGARLVTVPVTTDEGWSNEVLEQVMPRTAPALAYLMPDFHNPTGRTMPDEQRQRLQSLAAAHGTVLLVDETMAELGFGRDDQPAPFAIGAEQRGATVVTVGSVGKSIWGGIRLGWVRGDRDLITRLSLARLAGDLGSPVLEQLVLLRLLDSYDRVLAARRADLRTGHSLMIAELEQRFPSWAVPHVDGGLSLWVNLGAPVSSQLALAARAEGLLIGAGPRFGIDGAFERFLRLPFCHPAEHTLRALDLLELAWNRVVQREPLVASDEVLAAVV